MWLTLMLITATCDTCCCYRWTVTFDMWVRQSSRALLSYYMPPITLTKSFVWNKLTRQIKERVSSDKFELTTLIKISFISWQMNAHHVTMPTPSPSPSLVITYMLTHAFSPLWEGFKKRSGKINAAFWLRKSSIQLSFI